LAARMAIRSELLARFATTFQGRLVAFGSSIKGGGLFPLRRRGSWGAEPAKFTGFDNSKAFPIHIPKHDQGLGKRPIPLALEQVSLKTSSRIAARLKLVQNDFLRELRIAEALVAENFPMVRIDGEHLPLPALDCLNSLGPRPG